jgi:hypothetical protein
LEALLLALEDHHRPLAASVVSHPVDSLEHLLRDLLAVEDPLEDLVSSFFFEEVYLPNAKTNHLYLAGFGPPPGFAPQGGPRKFSILLNMG